MYTFSSRLKTFAFVLMVLGILGIGYSFFTAPKTIEDVEKIVAEEQAHGHHGDAHAAPAHDVLRDARRVDRLRRGRRGESAARSPPDLPARR